MPATIAVLDGVVHIGLGAAEVERVCTDPDMAKLSVRDVGVAAALGLSGATTVASTSALAHLAGIRVFATGGLGGVHRGASETFDVSADLGVIASTPVLVVCAGVKSILDVAGTLETLETLSVPVLGYRTDAFPGFYLSDSGHAGAVARGVGGGGGAGRRHARPARRPMRPASSSRTRCPPTGRSTAGCTTGSWPRGWRCSSARACTARTSRRGCSSTSTTTPAASRCAPTSSSSCRTRGSPARWPPRSRPSASVAGAPGSAHEHAPVVVVGDVGLDVITRPSGDIQWHSDTPSAVALVPGGAGGNSASWLAGLGADGDPRRPGRRRRRGRRRADTSSRPRGALRLRRRPALPTCMVVILLDAHGDRTMFPDRGANKAFSVADVDLGVARAARRAAAAPAPVGLRALRRRVAGGRPRVAAPGARRSGGRRRSTRSRRRSSSARASTPSCLGLGRGPAAAQRERGRRARWADRDPRPHAEVVATYGAAGARWVGAGVDESAEAPVVENVDATGCGDAFNAGLLSAWLRGEDPAAALRAGVAAGSAAAARVGARPG